MRKVIVLCVLALTFCVCLITVSAAKAYTSSTYVSTTWVTTSSYVSGDIVSPEYAAEKASGYDIFSPLSSYGFDIPVYALISNGPGGYKPFQANVLWRTDVASSDVVYWLLPSLACTYEWTGLDVEYEYFPEPSGWLSDKIGSYSGSFAIDAPTVSGTINYTFDLFQVSPEETQGYTTWSMRFRGQTIGAVGGFGTCFPLLAPRVYYSYKDAADAIGELQDYFESMSPSDESYFEGLNSTIGMEQSAADSVLGVVDGMSFDTPSLMTSEEFDGFFGQILQGAAVAEISNFAFYLNPNMSAMFGVCVIGSLVAVLIRRGGG